MEDHKQQVHDVLSAINQAWRTNTPLAMSQHLHPDIIMTFPGFAGEVAGRDALLSSFVEFCTNAAFLSIRR